MFTVLPASSPHSVWHFHNSAVKKHLIALKKNTLREQEEATQLSTRTELFTACYFIHLSTFRGTQHCRWAEISLQQRSDLWGLRSCYTEWQKCHLMRLMRRTGMCFWLGLGSVLVPLGEVVASLWVEAGAWSSETVGSVGDHGAQHQSRHVGHGHYVPCGEKQSHELKLMTASLENSVNASYKHLFICIYLCIYTQWIWQAVLH